MKALIVMICAGLAGYYGTDIVRKMWVNGILRDIQVFWEEYRVFRSIRTAWRVTVIRHEVRKVLMSGDLGAIRRMS